MYREIETQKILKNPYLLSGVIIMICVYLEMIYLTLINPYSDENNQIIKILWIPFQIFYIMVVWSMFRCIISEPGKVPMYWGFFLDDKEIKKRIYCMPCHIFKPERSHHCQVCQRCVLNMDHHCPYIGNCVGHQNRKFFILLLLYTNLSVLFSTIIISLQVYPIIIDLVFIDWKLLIQNFNIISTLLLTIIFLIFGRTIFDFFLFHLDLISTNKTTIEIKQVVKNDGNPNQQYDIGIKENWIQVMGTNPWLWPFPMFGESGRPKGNGVKWELNQNQ